MAVHQHAVEVREFARYLRDVTALLDPGRGWYAVFRGRDPQGVQACLEGVEVPPWDVVESLLQDLASIRGAGFAARESVRAAALYSASAAAHDRRPGGRHALVERLELMLREQSHAARRMSAAGVYGTRAQEADAQAWARDDHERATARCDELRKRLAAVTAVVPEDWFRARDGSTAAAGPTVEGRAAADGRAGARADRAPHRPDTGPAADTRARATSPRPSAPWAAPARTGRDAPAPGRSKPRGARFAGLETDDGDSDPGTVRPPVDTLIAPPPRTAAPRGARFSGAPAGGGHEGATPNTPASAPDTAESAARRAAEEAVGLLVRLRAQGRSGEAHVVLCEAAAWPPDRLPVLADALHRAGLAADWSTLLWEVSSIPPAELAAAAGALAAAGRAEDCGQLLRQGVARPAGEIADAVLALDRAGLEPEARALLGAFVRVHSAQDSALIAGSGSRHLVAQLLAAAREVSAAREWDLVHALRMAGIEAP